MKWKRLLVTCFIAGLLIAISLLLFGRFYVRSGVHPDLRSLNLPLQRIRAHYYFDGGSLGMELVDRDGKRIELSIPHWHTADDDTFYKYIYVGAKYMPKGAAVTPLNIHTKRFLIEMLEETSPERESKIALNALRADTFGERLFYHRKIKQVFD
jgi:hypothetical protein